MDGLLPIIIIFGIISFFSNMKKKEAEQKKKAQQAAHERQAAGHAQQNAPAQEKLDPLTTLMKKIDPRFEGWEEYIPLEKRQQAQKQKEPKKQPESAQMSMERDDATWRRAPITQSIESQMQSAVGTTHTLQTSVAPSRAEEKAKRAYAPKKAQADERIAAAVSVHALAQSGAGMLAEGFVLSEILGKPKALRR